MFPSQLPKSAVSSVRSGNRLDFSVYRTHLIVNTQKGELLKNTFPGNPDSRRLRWEQRIKKSHQVILTLREF